MGNLKGIIYYSIFMGHICKVAIFSFVLILQWSAIKAQQDYEISVSEKDVIDGYIPVKVRLQNYELPAVKLENIKFRPLNQDQDSSQIKSLDQLKVHIGKERKIPFAVIHIPVFLQDSSGKSVKFVTGFTLKVQEKDDTSATSPSSVPKRNSWKTTSINSPLATGTWYKVSVPASGLYKVDYDFIVSQLGVNNIASDQIRVFGHGGKMLSERNSSEIIEGLIENAIYIEDGGDGALGPGDFFMFYAQGPVNWYADDSNKNLIPKKNIYSDEGYYFLNFDGGTTGKRLDKQSSIPAGNITVNSYTGVALHEYDLVNPQRYGKKWWGEEFSNAPGKQTDQNFSLNVGNTIGNTKFSLNVVNTANSPGKFNISLNGQSIQSIEIGAANNYEYAPRALGKEVKFSAGVSGRADIEINYQNNSNDGSGWLDYISLNSVKPLDMESNSVTFTDLNSLRPGNKATYQISNASSGIQVWDISIPNNPLQMSGSWNNGIYSFTSDASTLHHFVAVNAPKSLPVPGFVSIIPNQNLFGSPQVDYIIVTHPEFKTAAERLGNFHRERDGMRVIIATTTQVYNEFSSGAQDIGAIRDFARMFYQRAGMNVENMPKYLLLLGDASYDYKDRISSNTNFVPTFESDESYDLINSFSNDDYFGFLDDNENIEDYSIINTVDIGIGRIPAKTSIEANEVVDKIIHYKNPGTLTPARINTMYIADNEDAAGDFINSTEIMKSAVDSEVDYLNSVKIYEDAIPFVSTPGGQRAPEANKAINDGIRKGMFMVNYIGHGNPSVLAHERILTIDDYNKWRNLDKLPFMVTATCDFGQFDQPSFVSSGERLLLKPDGGTIAMLRSILLHSSIV
ncbi:MAG: type IX secretion system sortase PorU [Candidatus Kuenenia stuttgartiensis]|nr:type IX secretion system sortase PorU [Candidatus Kuenenia stuttgartiensis]